MALKVAEKCIDEVTGEAFTGKDLKKCKRTLRKPLKKEFRALAKETCCKSKDDDDQVEPEVFAQVAQRSPEPRPIDCKKVMNMFKRKVAEKCGKVGGKQR